MDNGLQTIKLSELPEAITLNESDYSLIVQNGTSKKIKGLLLKGNAGDNGKSIEIQKTDTHIQWRQEGGQWINLVALADLKGDKGEQGGGANVDLTDYATKVWVTQQLASYYTKAEIDLSLSNKADISHTHTEYASIDHVHNYNDLTNKPTIPSKTSDLANDSGFLISIPSEYVTEEEMSTALSTKANKSDIPSLNGYATETFVTNKIAEAQLNSGEVDLSGYATKDDLTSKVDKAEGKSLSTNDLTNELKSNYDEAYLHSQSAHVQPTNYYTKTEIDSSLSTKANKSDIPSLNGYATETFVTNKIAEAQLSGAGLDIRDVEANEIFTVSNAEEDIPVYGNIVLSATSLSINEDSTGTFTVSLSTAPTNNQVVNISVDNNNCTVNKSSLTFTPDNYATAQTVTINTIHNSTNYSDLTSIVTLTSDNVTTQKVNVTITNIDVEKELSSINAVYTQGNTAIYPSTSLDSLKASLVVTATYSDNTSSNVTDYSLSGTLTEGTSTITVIYREKTATFDVTVSAEHKSNNFVSLETINNINYLSLATEKSSDGTPVNYLTLSEKTSYETELYRCFIININSEMALPLNKYSDFSSYIINGYTKNTNFNTWRSDSNIEESIMIYSNAFYCKVAKTNIEPEATMDGIFKYINNNILQHNNLKINASGLRATLTSSKICSYIDSSATIGLSKNGNNVLIRTNSSPFGSLISGSGFLNNYNWYGVPLNESRANNSGFAISSTSSKNRLNISIPKEHFTNDNLELTTENCKTVINNYYSDIEVYSWESLATS